MGGRLRFFEAAACWGLAAVMTVAAAAWGEGSAAGEDALQDAMERLAAAVLEVRMGEGGTIGGVITATELPKDDIRPLLRGAEEFPPRRVYGDGQVEVRVGIAVERLRENLRFIRESYYKGGDEAFGKAEFDRLRCESDPLVATGEARGAGVDKDGRVADAAGWESVPASRRVATERAAYEEALRAVAARARDWKLGGEAAVIEVFAEVPRAKAALGAYLDALRPESKAYLPGGAVEVKVVLRAGELVEKIESINAGMTQKERVKGEVLELMKQGTAGKELSETAYARADGKPFDPATLSQKPVGIDVGRLTGISME